MKRILLTGGTGFIGANLVRRLLREGAEVHLLLRPGCDAWRLAGIRDQCHTHDASILDRDTVAGLVRTIRPEWVFHLAAHGAYSWQTDPDEMARTNLVGTINLLDACLAVGITAFVHTGSSSEYGVKDHAPAETELPEPNSPYAVSKLAATNYCRMAALRARAPVTTLRLYSTYGPYEDANRLIPKLVVHGLQGALPPLADPGTARDLVHVEDVVDACLLAAQRASTRPGAIYNVGSGRQTTLREIVEMARDLLAIGEAPRWATLAGRPWDTSCWVADVRLITQELGWTARHSLAAGFGQTVDWFKRHPAMIAFYEKAPIRP